MRRRNRRWPWQPFGPYELGQTGPRLGLAPELRFGTMICPWLSRTTGDLFLRPNGGATYAFKQIRAGIAKLSSSLDEPMTAILKAIAAFEAFGRAVSQGKS